MCFETPEHGLTRGDFEVDFKLKRLTDDYEPTDHLDADFVMSDVDLKYDVSDARFPSITIENGKSDYDASAYRFEDYTGRAGFNADSIVSANFKWRNTFGNEKLTTRFGLKSRVRDDLVVSESSTYEGYEGGDVFSLATVLSEDFAKGIVENRYVLDVKGDKRLMDTFLGENLDLLEYNEQRSRERSDSTSRQVEERVDAIYGMIDYEAGRWRSLVGYRQENTLISFQSNEVLLGKDSLDKDGDGDFEEIVYLGTNPTDGDSSYGNAFPNTHVRYRWNDRTTVIASYTNTIDRSSYASVVPYRRVDLEDREILEGNPDLDPTLYENIDMSVDMHVGEGGLVSLEMFDRSVSDYVFKSESIISGGNYDGFQLDREENSASAQLRGMTLNWSQPIRLPLLADRFSINTNFKKQETAIEYPDRPGEILPLASHPESVMKISLNYDTSRLFAQLKFDQKDETIYRVSSDPEQDLYIAPRRYMALNVSYKLQDKTRWYMEWANVGNDPYSRTYEGDPMRAVTYQVRPWSLKTGMKFEL